MKLKIFLFLIVEWMVLVVVSSAPLIWDSRAKRNVPLDPAQQHVPFFPFEQSLRPPRPLLPKHRTPKIFIGIAAFRDAVRCGRTLLTAFKEAEDPTRITIGVVDQNIKSDDTCLDQYCAQARAVGYTNEKDECPHINQIRILAKDAAESKGPTTARSQQQSLIKDEDFCLQIDAHSVFMENWDSSFIEEWLKARNEMAVLSTYINDYNTYQTWPKDQHPHLCAAVVGQHGMVRNDGASVISNVNKPQLSCFWGAGLSFGKCHSETRVPLDPYTHWIFDGEEYMKAARLWTAGYDIYTSTIFKIYHDYKSVPHRFESVQINPEDKKREEVMGLNRMKLILGLPFEGDVSRVDLEKYSFAKIRSYNDYMNFSGINMNDRSKDENRCKQLHWVPYADFEPIRDIVQAQLKGGSMFYPPYPDGIPDVYRATGDIVANQAKPAFRGYVDNEGQQIVANDNGFQRFLVFCILLGTIYLLRKYRHLLCRRKLPGSSK